MNDRPQRIISNLSDMVELFLKKELMTTITQHYTEADCDKITQQVKEKLRTSLERSQLFADIVNEGDSLLPGGEINGRGIVATLKAYLDRGSDNPREVGQLGHLVQHMEHTFRQLGMYSGGT